MKIFIDPGHNFLGWDTGATGNGLREQDITFMIASKIAKILLKADCDVMLSREKLEDNLGYDLSSSLNRRCDMANKWNADLFISIHCNSVSDKTVSGTEVHLYNQNSKCREIAQNICNAISNKLRIKNRGTKYSNFAVLRNTNMKAMLIETAFISNEDDALKLEYSQDDFAEAIATEIINYYNLSTGEDVHLYKNRYNFYINNKKVNIDSVLINGNNYIKLRDIVTALGGTVDKVEGKTVYIKK